MIDLKQSVQYIKGVGPQRAALLRKLNIYTLEDLITYFPRDYEDRSAVRTIDQLAEDEENTFFVSMFLYKSHLFSN